MSKKTLTQSSASNPLNQRAQYLLKTLINCYVNEGIPVGSKTLAESAGLNISTATIRNVMANLDSMGLVSAPHTSAGRVPTNMGFRLYVDSMLEFSPLEAAIKERIKQELNSDQDKDSLINVANNLLTDLTQMAGIITLPKSGQLNLRRIEFLPFQWLMNGMCKTVLCMLIKITRRMICLKFQIILISILWVKIYLPFVVD